MNPVLSVSQLNFYIKSLIDGDPNLRTVLVCGEISNFTNHYRTGHFYMTLKDGGAAIKAVMFKSANQRLRFTPENGMKVICRGRVSVFERDGQYQLYIDDMQPDGAGALNLAFEQLKKKLGAEGLFDPERKKPIPGMPMRVGVITSPTGAAVRDITNVLSRRFPLAEMVFCPVTVQGSSAAPEISAALRKMNALNAADVIIVGRGGGSLEDLWAFNEEQVARAVADSVIPVISAVGHETDFTICDFVADLRAPTPSAAAELAVPDIREQRERILGCTDYLTDLALGSVKERRMELGDLGAALEKNSPFIRIANTRMLCDRLQNSMYKAAAAELSAKRTELSALAAKLDALSPLKIFERGFAAASKDGVSVSSVEDVEVGDAIALRLSDGSLRCAVTGKE